MIQYDSVIRWWTAKEYSTLAIIRAKSKMKTIFLPWDEWVFRFSTTPAQVVTIRCRWSCCRSDPSPSTRCLIPVLLPMLPRLLRSYRCNRDVEFSVSRSPVMRFTSMLTCSFQDCLQVYDSLLPMIREHSFICRTHACIDQAHWFIKICNTSGGN